MLSLLSLLSLLFSLLLSLSSSSSSTIPFFLFFLFFGRGDITLTSKLAGIHVEGKLLVLQVEHLVVLVLVIHQVDSGTDIAASLELQAQGIARCLDTVGTRVVGTIQRAVRRTSSTVRAKGLVPSVTGVAVGRSRSGVKPAPVAVKDNALGLGCASAGRASRDGERGVLLRGECTSLLSLYDRTQGEGSEGEGEGRHAGRLEQGCSTAGVVGCVAELSSMSRTAAFI